jgi:hypothetical protein
MHAIDDPACPLNTSFCRDLAGWGRLTDRICIWNYTVNYLDLLLPCPNLRVIGPNIRYFVANRTTGLFMEADGSAQGTDLADLRNYLICRLMWDPRRDAQALTEEFLRLHYGRAAGPIRAYIDLIHDNAAKRGLHHDCFGTAAHYGIDAPVAAQAVRLFDQALAAADDEAVRARVEKASIGAYRAAIEPLLRSLKPDPWRFTPSDAPVPKEIADVNRPELRRFMALCDKYGIDTMSVSEPKSFADMKVQLRKRLGLKPDEPW